VPTSLDPPPAENEIECARCGTHFYYELTRCPNCGVNLYEPEDEPGGNDSPAPIPRNPGLGDKLSGIFHRLSGKPYRAEQVFGDALDQAALYNDLLRKVGGDHLAADRLVEHERQLAPQSTRRTWLQNAIQRWERDNQAPPAK
jgi:predicted  nucleic acid-binding Zn-ribbon protein